MSTADRANYARKYYILNKDRLKVYRKDHYTKNIEKAILQRAAKRAKTKGLLFDLALEDIIIPPVCPILGLIITIGDYRAAPHLDRIVPERGYTRGNVRVISGQANRIKTDATPAEIRKVADFLEGKV